MEYLPGYIHAIRQRWSPDDLQPQRAEETLARIEESPGAFVAGLVDHEGKGPPVSLPDGTMVPRLPGYAMWMWDGEFCGSISLRWQPGTTALPWYCLGHIGYVVVSWKRCRGYATRALGLVLPHARAEGLPCVELTTDAHNIASQRVIEANGGVLIERFSKPSVYGGDEGLRYRIALDGEQLSPR